MRNRERQPPISSFLPSGVAPISTSMHFGGTTWSDLLLAKTPADRPLKTFDPYLGDYDHLVAVGKIFYGIFSASNIPDRANFPNGVVYQRNADFTSRKLLSLDGATPVNASIDPFFFKVSS